MLDWNRWLPGLGTDEPEEDDPVTKTLKALGQGVQDVGAGISQGVADVGAGISSGLSSAAQTVQDAYAVPTEERPPAYSGPSYAQPSLAPGQPSMLEQLPEVGQAGLAAGQQYAVDRGALLSGLRRPETPMEVAEQAMPAPARAGQFISEIGQSAGGAAVRRFAEGTVRPDEDVNATVFTRPAIGPFPSADWTRGDIGQAVGSVLGDPTTYLGFGAAGRAADAPVDAAMRAAGQHIVAPAARGIGRGVGSAVGAVGDLFQGNAARTAALEGPGVQMLGSGVVPAGGEVPAPSTLGPVGQRVMDTYTALTPKRVEAVTARGNQVAADAIARRTRPGLMPMAPAELVEQVHAAVVRNLDDTKVVMTGLNPGALRAFLRGEGLTSKAETGDLGLINQITQGQVNVAGGRLKLVDGKRVKVPYSLEDAADFAQRESEQMRGVTGGTRFPDPETGAIDTEAPKVLYAYVSEGQPLVAPNRPTLGLVWKPETPRVSSVNHPFGLLSRAQDIHVGMAEGNKALVYSPEAIRGARHAPAVMEGGRLVEAAPGVRGSGELAFGWEQGGIDVGGGRKLVDTDYLVGPEGESSLRATALVSGMSKDIQEAIARGQMTDPEQIAAVLMRGGSPQWKPGWGSVMNPTRTESLVLDPHLANVQAIYISGTPKNLASMLEGSKTGGVGGGKGERLAELEMARRMRAAIKAETNNDVPIIFNDTTRTAASTAQLEAGASNAGWAPRLISDAQVLEGPPLTLSPGRGRIVDQYTQAIDPTTGEPYMNIGGGVVPRLRSDAFNAAQGGVMGAASEDLQAQAEGREADPAERARRALIGGGLAVAGGRYARPGATGAARLGSGVVPSGGPRIRATPEQLAAETARGATRGAALNRAVVPPPSAVPLVTRFSVEATDDRAGVRWAEDMLTDASGRSRMRENDPRRPSTLSRENAASIGNERLRDELEPAIISAGKAGLHDELPQHLEDMQQRDILAEFYRRGRQEALDAAEPGLERMRAKGASPETIAAAEQRIEAAADAAGVRRMRAREGGSVAMTWEKIDARLSAQEQRLKASGQWDQLQGSAEQVWEHNATTRRRAHESGEIDAETLAYYEETYPHYVPTVPLSHLDARGGPTASSSARVNRGREPLVRSLEDVGTSGERLNPLAASRSATLRAERSMQKNRTTRAFAQLYDEALEAAPGDLAAPSGKKNLLQGDTEVSYIENGEPVTIRVPKVVADGLEAAAAMGADTGLMGRAQRSVMSTVTSSMTASRASFLPVNVMRDLQDYAVRTATLEGGGAQRVPGILGDWLSEAGKAASDITLAQLNPRGAVGAATGFAAGAAVGDEDTTVAERLRHGAAGAVAGTFLVGANRVRPTGKAREFLARGGGSGGADTGWRASQRWLRDVQRQGGTPISTPAEAARALGDWMQDVVSLQGIKGINERGELISRTAAMNRAERVRGLDPTEATMAGRDITYDPDRAGRVARAVNGIVPFFNATTQSGAQFVRLLKQNPVAATTTMVTTVAPVVAAAEAWNRSDPDRARVYDDVPDYVKNTGLVVVTPWAGSDNRGERPNYLWIPTGIVTPFVLGIRESMRNVPGLEPRAEGTTPESDAERWAGTLNDVLQVFNPVRGDTAGSLASNLVPPIVKQAVELSNNRDLYRGMPIMSDVADERASAASKTIASGARSVGRVVGSDFLQEVRPSGVEHLVRSLPAYGDIVTGASDMVAPSGYKQAEDRPVANEPFLGGVGARFVRDTGGQSLQDAEADRLGPGVRAVLEEAGLPPSTIGTVGSRYQNGPLTREEQLAWQEATNAEAERFVSAARRDARWRQPATREDAIRDAMTKARDAGAKRARLPGSSEIQRRIRDEERMRVG